MYIETTYKNVLNFLENIALCVCYGNICACYISWEAVE